jgi:hypothetical protein
VVAGSEVVVMPRCGMGNTWLELKFGAYRVVFSTKHHLRALQEITSIARLDCSRVHRVLCAIRDFALTNPTS